jgi:cytidylate kinase
VDVGIVIAVDGPSGSGKSTVARAVAARRGLRYLDTGAMYRAVTWAVLDRHVDPSDAAAVADLARTVDLQISTDPAPAVVHVGPDDVSAAIRGPAVTTAVSAVSAVPQVRTLMVARQRAIIGAGGIVVEGRDIGTTVAPDADLKVFLTASPHARASRRTHQVGDTDVAATRSDLERRDRLDSGRASSPLAQAADAVVIDSTDMTVDEVVDAVLARLPARSAS